MTTEIKEFDVLLRDERLRGVRLRVGGASAASHSPRLRLLRHWTEVKPQSKRDLFVVLAHKDLLDGVELGKAKKAKTRGTKRYLVLRDDSPPESLEETIVRLNVRSIERFHAVCFDFDAPEAFVRRFLAALSRSDERRTIADAWWEGDRLVLLSPTFERLKVPAEAIPALRAAPPEERNAFEIDEQGEYIHWPTYDVHMGWSQFLQAVDPAAQVRAQRKSAAFNRAYGKAIHVSRTEAGLKQSDIPGLDERTVRRIEHGETPITSSALEKLARAHNMPVNDYMSALAERL